MQNAHLMLGLSRRELERRVSVGQIDPQILKNQIEQNSREVRLSTLCETRLRAESLEQVDGFSESE